MTEPGVLVGGRYRLAERIGAGAMGVVWRALDERLGRTVALKQLAVSASSLFGGTHAEASERIMREGRLAARLHHPNAISVFDVVDHGGAPWLVMEYLPARSLATVLAERGPLPPQEVAAIGRQVADALAAAHDAGIVHRDIKPGNVLLGGNGVVKLTDFGISRAADEVAVTRTGVVAGTPAYLAPEVARGAEPGPASDVFALGSTLYAAVEGQPPFGSSDNAIALLHQVAAGRVLPPRQAGPLTALLMRLLRTEPAERPTAAEVRDELATLLAGRHPASAATMAAPPPAPFPAGSASRPPPTRMDLFPVAGQQAPPGREPDRRPALLIAGGVALSVLAVLLVLAATTGPEPPAAQKGPTTPQPSATTAATTVPPTTTPPPTTTRQPATAAELQRAVVDYYALLPDDPDEAWARLGPNLQAGGFDPYEEFWDGIDSVQAVPAQVNAGAMTVRVFLVYRRDDERPQAEVRELVLIQHGDGLLIDQDTRIGSVAAPTTTRKRRG